MYVISCVSMPTGARHTTIPKRTRKVASSSSSSDMLQAEYYGVQELAASRTIRVPTPLCYCKDGTRAFVVFEYLQFCSGGSGRETGVQLAKMHRTLSSNGLFGFHVDNTIGATPQDI